MKNRSGETITNLSGELAYKSFRPSCLPPIPGLQLSNELMLYTIEANRQLSYLEGVTSLIPDVKQFVSMYVRKEALLSSQIEGTQCTLEDILDPLADFSANRDVTDVVNYIKAMDFALEELNRLPLCCRMIREIHSRLMDGVRGQEKTPGEFRRTQNWIGGQCSTLKNARYIPPNVEDMEAAMSDLEKFINSENEMDSLIQTALIHYQFETIHPFLDGNGRVGRLLITLFLIQKKVLSAPILYTSLFLKMNRTEYYDRMTQVRRSGDYEQWVLFFLKMLTDAAVDAIENIRLISNLHNSCLQKLSLLNARSGQSAVKVFRYLETSPIIDVQKTADALGLSYNTTAKAVSTLEEMGILQQESKNGRTRIYCFREYLDLLKKGT